MFVDAGDHCALHMDTEDDEEDSIGGGDSRYDVHNCCDDVEKYDRPGKSSGVQELQ